MTFSMRMQLFLRSFFLQTGWNYMKYQNIGLTFVMLPFLKQAYKDDKDALPSVLQRYLENFNTQPVMASFCFGALARQEEAVAKAMIILDSPDVRPADQVCIRPKEACSPLARSSRIIFFKLDTVACASNKGLTRLLSTMRTSVF